MPVLYRGFRGHVLQKYPVNAPAIVLGRDVACDIVLKGTGVSRRHCQLRQSPEGYYIEDLASSNGTLLNGERVIGKELLKDGDKIVLMGHILTFRTVEEAPVESFQPPVKTVPSSGEEYPPTEKVDPEALRRRVERLLREESESVGDDDEKKGS